MAEGQVLKSPNPAAPKPPPPASVLKEAAKKPQAGPHPEEKSISAPRSGTVLVGCKLPHGLQISATDNDGELVHVKLNGSRTPVQATIHRPMPTHTISSGYGLTTVDRGLWERWLDEHRTYPAVQSGMIFAVESAASAKDRAKDGLKVKTGFEPAEHLKKPKDAKPGELSAFDAED
jgi:hypothetical protein